MQNIKELANSTINKLQSKTTSPILNDQATPKLQILPHWQATLFRIFTISYKNLWTDNLCTDQMRKATDQLWFSSLKDFSLNAILKAAQQIVVTLKYPHL